MKSSRLHHLDPIYYEPSIKYVTLFCTNFDPPSLCHTLSHISEPPLKYVTHLGPLIFSSTCIGPLAKTCQKYWVGEPKYGGSKGDKSDKCMGAAHALGSGTCPGCPPQKSTPMHRPISLQGVCLSSRAFVRGFVQRFLSGRFCPGWFCPFPLLSDYIRYNRKLNTTFNFRFHMYEFF